MKKRFIYILFFGLLFSCSTVTEEIIPTTPKNPSTSKTYAVKVSQEVSDSISTLGNISLLINGEKPSDNFFNKHNLSVYLVRFSTQEKFDLKMNTINNFGEGVYKLVISIAKKHAPVKSKVRLPDFNHKKHSLDSSSIITLSPTHITKINIIVN
ncbi:hypothetical protein [Flammeovirga agarivorans]|uniref:Lipoprotein n=1 Tax=Flammeovirga agarivorans TaxID=2726742 RepID=A0A7X8SQX3_9BACT|nr:hypothetical protein [Flammeovirga agarivorans]NLR94769.1 hypothetical protein [Flammeovirga agarivorans]